MFSLIVMLLALVLHQLGLLLTQFLVVLHDLLFLLLVLHLLLLHYQWLDCLLVVHAIPQLVLVVVLHSHFHHCHYHCLIQNYLLLHIHYSPLLQSNHLTGFYPSPKSFWSCTNVNSCQNYILYINLHILLNILSKTTSNIQESRKSIKYLKR